jgi:hypothetical protein
VSEYDRECGGPAPQGAAAQWYKNNSLYVTFFRVGHCSRSLFVSLLTNIFNIFQIGLICFAKFYVFSSSGLLINRNQTANCGNMSTVRRKTADTRVRLSDIVRIYSRASDTTILII